LIAARLAGDGDRVNEVRHKLQSQFDVTLRFGDELEVGQ
jgi:hypothetical protein